MGALWLNTLDYANEEIIGLSDVAKVVEGSQQMSLW
jgi:hypothetical protein